MAEYICTACGWEGERKKRLRGSQAMHILVWSLLFFPGPFYWLWRHTGKQKECPNCGVPVLVKLSSDEGLIAQRKFDLAAGLLAPMKDTMPEALKRFGNDRRDNDLSAENEKPVEQSTPRKPVNPDEW